MSMDYGIRSNSCEIEENESIEQNWAVRAHVFRLAQWRPEPNNQHLNAAHPPSLSRHLSLSIAAVCALQHIAHQSGSKGGAWAPAPPNVLI